MRPWESWNIKGVEPRLARRLLLKLEQDMQAFGRTFASRSATLQDGSRVKLTINKNGINPIFRARQTFAIDDACVDGLYLWVDYNSDGKPDVAFYGDSCGNVWRHIVDPSTPMPIWVGGVWTNIDDVVFGDKELFFVAELDGLRQGIYEKPQIVSHPTAVGAIVIVATGLRGQTQRGSIYGLWDNYGTVAIPLARGDLLSQYIWGSEQTHTSGNSVGRVTSRFSPDWLLDTGWKFDLPTGEYLAAPIDLYASGVDDPTPGDPKWLYSAGSPPTDLYNFYKDSLGNVVLHVGDANSRRWIAVLMGTSGQAPDTVTAWAPIDFNRDGAFTSADAFTGSFTDGAFVLTDDGT